MTPHKRVQEGAEWEHQEEAGGGRIASGNN